MAAEDEQRGVDAISPAAPANDNHGVAAAIDPRILAVARAIGRQMARERFAALARQAANDNRRAPGRDEEG